MSSIYLFNDTATTEIYTLSLHDALPISSSAAQGGRAAGVGNFITGEGLPNPAPNITKNWGELPAGDRKSTRLNSSHGYISYAVFCLKKKIKSETQFPILQLYVLNCD